MSGKGESLEHWLGTLTHLNLQDKALTQLTALEHCHKLQVYMGY
jgi:hypothetical protein